MENQKKHQIIRKDGKGCLMEVNTQALSIGRLQFVFAKYDENRPKGQRTTDRIVIYMDFATALEFAHSVLDGRLAKELQKANQKFEQTKQPWDKDVILTMGGTANPKNRQDGKSESRILKAQLGTNKPIALIASSGPGVVNEKGLIIPEKGAKVEHSVLLPLTAKDIREVAVMIKAHVESYITFEHLNNLWTHQPLNNENQNASSGNNNQPNNQQYQQSYGASQYSQGNHAMNGSYQSVPPISDDDLPF